MQARGRESGPLGPAEPEWMGLLSWVRDTNSRTSSSENDRSALKTWLWGAARVSTDALPNTASASKRVPRRAAPDDGVARPPPARPGHHAGAAPEHARPLQRPAWLCRPAARAMAPLLQQRRLNLVLSNTSSQALSGKMSADYGFN